MRNAMQIHNDLSAQKEAKYQRMIRHQEEIIEDAIKKGNKHGSRLFIFSDKEYFRGIEEEWYDELYMRAKKELEDAGYTINGICVVW